MAREADARRSRWSERLVDGVLAATVTAVMALVISANHGGRQEPDALAYLWAVGLGALVLVRRRHPIVVLVVSVLGLFAYYAAGYPAVGVAVPIAAALWSAAEFGHPVPAIIAGLVTVAASVAFRLAEGQPSSLVLGYELAGHLLLVAAAVAVGDGIRSRRAAASRANEILALTEERAEREAELTRQAERLALARELHDSVGHTAAVVAIHADVADEAATRGDVAATVAAVRVIKETTSSTLTELRRTVTTLRRPDPASVLPRAPRLNDLAGDLSQGLGLEISTTVEIPTDLPADVETAAARIVEEALTNVARHSTAAHASVRILARPGGLVVEISDHGPPRELDPAERGRPRHGITGMRERAEELGGTLDAGPAPDGGFVVRAHLPLGDGS